MRPSQCHASGMGERDEMHVAMRAALRLARAGLAGTGASLERIQELDGAIVKYMRGHDDGDLEAQRQALAAACSIVPALRTAALTWEARNVVAGARRLFGGE